MASDSYGEPDWLKGSNTSSPATQEDKDSANFTSSLEIDDNPTASPSVAQSSSSTPKEKSQFWTKCVRYSNWGISLGLLVIFIIAAIVQDNDASSSLNWLLFYAFHATTAAVFFFFRACFKSMRECMDKPLLALGAGMLVWSIVMVGISGKKLSDAKSSDPGGDSSKFNDKEEKALEVAGAAIGMFSAIYHVMIWKFCCKGDQ